MVRRRVPHPDSEDVVQAALADALAAENPPADPSDVPRWLVGIARHKVADYHRAQRRVAPAPADVPTDPPPHETRDMLEKILGEARRDARAAQTMAWMVREAEGESLADLAREAALPSTQVRKRVSRMRRLLRDRWIFALITVLAVGAVGAASRWRAPPSENASHGAATGALAKYDGVWRIARVEPGRSLDDTRRLLVDRYGSSSKVRVEGGKVTLTWPAGESSRIMRVRETNGRHDLELKDDRGQTTTAIVTTTIEGNLVFQPTSGPWNGTTLILVR
jgi:DNA-directed RNA polymerase specialized sigma24 family protein